MQFIEAMQMLQARPGWVAWLPGRLMLRLSAQGRIEDATRQHRPTAAVLRVADTFAVTWEVHEPRQLENLLTQQLEGQGA